MAALAQSNAQLGDLSRCHHRTSARPSSAGVGLQLGQLLCCIWVGWFFWGGGGSTMSQSSERSAWAPQKLCLTSQPDSVSLVRGDPASSCAGGAAQHLLGSHWAQREGNPQGTSAQCQRRGSHPASCRWERVGCWHSRTMPSREPTNVAQCDPWGSPIPPPHPQPPTKAAATGKPALVPLPSSFLTSPALSASQHPCKGSFPLWGLPKAHIGTTTAQHRPQGTQSHSLGRSAPPQ